VFKAFGPNRRENTKSYCSKRQLLMTARFCCLLWQPKWNT